MTSATVDDVNREEFQDFHHKWILLLKRQWQLNIKEIFQNPGCDEMFDEWDDCVTFESFTTKRVVKREGFEEVWNLILNIILFLRHLSLSSWSICKKNVSPL